VRDALYEREPRVETEWKEKTMALFTAAVLIIGGLVGAAVLVVSIPTLFALMAHDVIDSRRREPAEPVRASARDTEGRIFLERGFARGFVIAGGVFWSAAIFAALYVFRQSGMTSAIVGAFLPLAATLAVLVIGWYYERAAALLLAAASIAVVAWGVIFQFELGVWIILSCVLIGPMAIAAVLFWMARREQEAMELAQARQLELVAVASMSQSAK
jgi:hypothetical protein